MKKEWEELLKDDGGLEANVCVCVCDIMFCAVLMTSIAGFSYRSGISAQPVNTVTHTNTRCTHTRTHIFSVTPLVHIGKADDLKV